MISYRVEVTDSRRDYLLVLLSDADAVMCEGGEGTYIPSVDSPTRLGRLSQRLLLSLSGCSRNRPGWSLRRPSCAGNKPLLGDRDIRGPDTKSSPKIEVYTGLVKLSRPRVAAGLWPVLSLRLVLAPVIGAVGFMLGWLNTVPHGRHARSRQIQPEGAAEHHCSTPRARSVVSLGGRCATR